MITMTDDADNRLYIPKFENDGNEAIYDFYFPDDAKFWHDVFMVEWSYNTDKKPKMYYDPNKSRTTMPISLYFYVTASTTTNYDMGYFNESRTRNMSIDIQSKNRELAFGATREVHRILRNHRRAGKKYLNGWDYLEVTGTKMIAGYEGYYQHVVEFRLVSKVTPITGMGFI